MASLLVRFFLYFSASAGGILVIIFSLEYQKFTLERSQSKDQESLRLALAYKTIQRDLRESIEDLRTIAALQVVHDYAHQETTENRLRLEKDFMNFSINARQYGQIRYVDAAGMEKVRINFDGRIPVVVPPEQLQDKSQRYYFREAIRLKQNSIYVSPLDLNVEEGQVEQPVKPTIRFIASVFDSDGQLRGVVVLNYLAARLLDNFWEFMTGSWGEPMMVNPQGYWLASPNREEEWGFMLGHEETFKNRFTEAWDHIVRHESGAVETAAGMFIFGTIRPYAMTEVPGATLTREHLSEYYWKIITRVPPQALTFSPMMVLEERTRELIESLLLVGILSVALAWLRTSNLTKANALRESERQLADAQHIAHVGNWVWDIPKGTLSWSDEIYRIFGRPPKASHASYEAFIDAVHPDDRGMVTAAVDAALKDNAPYVIDHRIILPDGSVRYVHERAALQYDRAGNPLRMLGTVQDITESIRAAQALRKSEARYRNLFENIVDGYALQEAMFNDEGKPYDYRYLEINPAFERILGLKREQVVGKTVLEVLPDTEPHWLEVFGRVAVTGQSQRLEHYGKSFDRYFEIVASSPEYGLVAVFFADVTERKRAEKQLQKYHEQLEERVAQRTAALEASNKELETFSYSIAHDLRTPLRSITSFSQILMEEAGAKLTEQERQDLQRIINAGKHMSDLIDDILELARISRSEFTMTTVNLSKLAKTVLENFKRVQPERSVQVDIARNLLCKGDARLLNIVLQNLLSNAWKYTGKCTTACIEFGETNFDNQKVYFVRDNGVGFDMQYAHKLFTPFGRLHKSDEFDGTGIGLVSVQSAIQRHKGKIWAESKIGEGSTFYFTLHVFQSDV